MTYTDNTTNDTAHTRSITALFDTQTAADKARRDLLAAGLTADAIQIVEGGATTASGTTASSEPHGFWESLKGMFLPDEDRHVYAEGLRRGGYLLTVRTTPANYDRVLDIVDTDGSVDLEQRETTWRSEGWKGL